MDLNILRAMNALQPTFAKSSFPLISSTPAVSQITPGVGLFTPLYSTYVPIRMYKNFPHEIRKEVEPIIITEDIQIGTGTNEQNLENKKLEESEPLDHSEQNTQSVKSSKESLISEGVQFSFLHPRIETDKIIFPKKRSAPKNKSIPPKLVKTEHKMKHKFQFN